VNSNPGGNDRRLFWACFIALIATAFGFIIRALIMNDLAAQFGLSETQKGEIFGVGLWPFAVSIVVFSLVIDRIGYGKAMVFAFICHCVSAVVTICAPMVLAPEGSSADAIASGQARGYWMLYIGNLIVALGNGTVEAVINPVVATMFIKEKTKWLNILHAGWPGGLVLGGLLTIAMGPTGPIGAMSEDPISWQWKVGLIFLPVALYGVMMTGCQFPVNERVAAGVPYKTMLQEVGVFGALIVTMLIVSEIGRVFSLESWLRGDIVVFLTLCYGIYVLTFGRPLFVFLLIIMIPLATTELGTDSWITSILEDVLEPRGLHAGWVLVYTSFIMMVLRFFAGPIVHRLSPLGLLAASSAVAAVGLYALGSSTTGMAIFVAATVYGFGKTFFWPTMLGVVSERFPKGGALTLNAMGGVGMLSVGVFGAQFLGFILDNNVDTRLAAHDEKNRTELHATYVTEKKTGLFGEYRSLDKEKREQDTQHYLAAEAMKSEIIDGLVTELGRRPTEEEQEAAFIENSEYQDAIATREYKREREVDEAIEDAEAESKRTMLKTTVIFPVIMFLCYVGLILYFRARGGYKAEVLAGHAAEDEKFTGGVEGPVE
jgi:MFS family permease